MSAREIDEYLAGLDETKRHTLETMRRTILEVAPDCAAHDPARAKHRHAIGQVDDLRQLVRDDHDRAPRCSDLAQGLAQTQDLGFWTHFLARLHPPGSGIGASLPGFAAAFGLALLLGELERVVAGRPLAVRD